MIESVSLAIDTPVGAFTPTVPVFEVFDMSGLKPLVLPGREPSPESVERFQAAMNAKDAPEVPSLSQPADKPATVVERGTVTPVVEREAMTTVVERGTVTTVVEQEQALTPATVTVTPGHTQTVPVKIVERDYEPKVAVVEHDYAP
ncbi:MAG: hypothetical protein IJQ65_01590, partial [Kiritimatiellae bacterium]|nr:hypothetical protein [Kiritimatiellia bacterium]